MGGHFDATDHLLAVVETRRLASGALSGLGELRDGAECYNLAIEYVN